jgi:hypothetical protein
MDGEVHTDVPKLKSETFTDAVIELSKLYSNICYSSYS